MSYTSSPPRKPSAPCFDAGTPYCPCDLAFLGSCVQCSIIRGEDVCTCGWSGLCVYQEFLRRAAAMPPRREASAKVSARTDLSSSSQGAEAFAVDIVDLEGLTPWCVYPGSFVMLRPMGTPTRYNVPISIMQVKGDGIRLAVEVQGPKTRALGEACLTGAQITVTGPYWSGLQGAMHLRTHGSGRVLVIAKGIGQAPALNAVQYLSGRGAQVKALLGPGMIGTVFSDTAMRDAGAVVEVLPRAKDHNIAYVYQELCRGYDLLVSEGGDRQHRALLGLCESIDDPPAFAWSSNLTMSCAEGICGSCLRSGMRGCKANLEAGTALE